MPCISISEIAKPLFFKVSHNLICDYIICGLRFPVIYIHLCFKFITIVINILVYIVCGLWKSTQLKGTGNDSETAAIN